VARFVFRSYKWLRSGIHGLLRRTNAIANDDIIDTNFIHITESRLTHSIDLTKLNSDLLFGPFCIGISTKYAVIKNHH